MYCASVLLSSHRSSLGPRTSRIHTHAHTTIMQVPVGNGTLGRIINVIGEPVDEQGPIRECALSVPAFSTCKHKPLFPLSSPLMLDVSSM